MKFKVIKEWQYNAYGVIKTLAVDKVITTCGLGCEIDYYVTEEYLKKNPSYFQPIPEEPKRWKPKSGEEYFHVYVSDGIAFCDRANWINENGDAADKLRLLNNNVFKEEYAEKCAEEIRQVMVKWRKIQGEDKP